MKHEADLVKGTNFKYLGHFANANILRNGHNTIDKSLTEPGFAENQTLPPEREYETRDENEINPSKRTGDFPTTRRVPNIGRSI